MTVAIICYSIATALLGLAVVLLSIYSRRLWNIQCGINEDLLGALESSRESIGVILEITKLHGGINDHHQRAIDGIVDYLNSQGK